VRVALDILAQITARGIRIRTDGEHVLISPRSRLTDEICALIRDHKAEILAALAHEVAHTGGALAAAEGGRLSRQAAEKRTGCMGCTHLRMDLEHHPGTRRVWWWRCEKGYELMEGRNFGERILLAPSECDRAGVFEPWKPGQR
jgi:hypothetical protein